MDDVLTVLMNAVRHLLHREVARSGEEDGELHEHLAAVTAATGEPLLPPAQPVEASPSMENEHAEDNA